VENGNNGLPAAVTLKWCQADGTGMRRPVVTFSRNVFLPLTSVCRNRCGYCCFRTPAEEGALMQPAEVRRVLKLGAAAGCTEALFTFGERPELEPGFAELLGAIGYGSILDYCVAMCEEAIGFGLLPHTNAGILTEEELARFRKVNASMGLMLETTADLDAHRNSPGKTPEVRIAMIEAAGRLRIPFTTGILVGIGETAADREESLETIRDIHRRYGHIQEVIVQNFCPKPGTPMAGLPGPTREEMCAAVALARTVLPQDIAVQVAPNLIEAESLVACGATDLGGISPLTIDYVNPEHPWPALEDLRKRFYGCIFRERLCIYPQFIEKGWYDLHIEALIKKREQELLEMR
jgi:FO synthase subunit 1